MHNIVRKEHPLYRLTMGDHGLNADFVVKVMSDDSMGPTNEKYPVMKDDLEQLKRHNSVYQQS